MHAKIFCFKKTVKLKKILKEGENQVKSLWPLWVGLHTCYNENDKKQQKLKPLVNL